jgi:Zn-dependent peptidase ImmA (M78 family)
MKATSLNDAVLFAEKIIRDEKLELPVDLFELARRHDIIVQPKPTNSKGVSGMLIRSAECFTIVYATHIKSLGFQRFCIAHELGHYFLPSHPEYIFSDGKSIHESHAGFSSGNLIELEADHFAAGLLMPKQLFIKEADKSEDGLLAIEKLAESCKTSLTAAAIRYAQLTEAAIAIVVSSGSFIEYCFASKSMRKVQGYMHLKKGMNLPRDSNTWNFNQSSSNITNNNHYSDETDLMTWFQTDNEIEAREEIVGLGSYGKTLTIITADLPDEDADENEDAWEEPRFR